MPDGGVTLPVPAIEMLLPTVKLLLVNDSVVPFVIVSAPPPSAELLPTYSVPALRGVPPS